MAHHEVCCSALTWASLGEAVGPKIETQIPTMPWKQVPEAGAASPGDHHCTHKVTIFMVDAAQLRIFISQFDGFLDPSHFVIKSEVPDSDFLGADIMSPVVANSLRQGSMHHNTGQLTAACCTCVTEGAAARTRTSGADLVLCVTQV